MFSYVSIYIKLYISGKKEEEEGESKKKHEFEEEEVEEEVGGVRVDGLLRGLGWVERQLSSTDNIHLLHAFKDSNYAEKSHSNLRKYISVVY